MCGACSSERPASQQHAANTPSAPPPCPAAPLRPRPAHPCPQGEERSAAVGSRHSLQITAAHAGSSCARIPCWACAHPLPAQPHPPSSLPRHLQPLPGPQHRLLQPLLLLSAELRGHPLEHPRVPGRAGGAQRCLHRHRGELGTPFLPVALDALHVAGHWETPAGTDALRCRGSKRRRCGQGQTSSSDRVWRCGVRSGARRRRSFMNACMKEHTSGGKIQPTTSQPPLYAFVRSTERCACAVAAQGTHVDLSVLCTRLPLLLRRAPASIFTLSSRASQAATTSVSVRPRLGSSCALCVQQPKTAKKKENWPQQLVHVHMQRPSRTCPTPTPTPPPNSRGWLPHPAQVPGRPGQHQQAGLWHEEPPAGQRGGEAPGPTYLNLNKIDPEGLGGVSLNPPALQPACLQHQPCLFSTRCPCSTSLD